MNKNEMLYFKIHDSAVTSASFQICLDDIKIVCLEKSIINPIIILDNARIHHARILDWSAFTPSYLPPYCPFLNPTENCFSKWKNYLIRQRCNTEEQLNHCIENGFSIITSEDFGGYYKNMLRYLNKSANKEEINN